MSSPFRIALAALLGTVACRSDPAPEATPAKPLPAPDDQKQSAQAGTSAAADEACTDWSKFDVSKLASLPESDYAATLDEVWRRVLEKHYDPTLGCLDWPDVRLRYAGKLEGITGRPEAYGLINEMLGELEQSHFHLFVPGGGGDEAVGPASPPMQARWIEERLIVVRSDVASVPPGAELVAVDRKPLTDAIERARERSKAGGASFTSLVGRAADARTSCDAPGQTHLLEISLADGRSSTQEVTCETPAGELTSMGNLSNIRTSLDHRVIEGTKVGYVAFNIWMLPLAPRIEQAVRELQGAGVEALILDLRGNPGGVGPMSVPVARLVLQESASLGKLQFRDFAQEFQVEADDRAFDGPVALLVDEGTASTSEIFAAGLRDLERVRVFGGGPSAGAALPSVIEELEGGAILQYVVGDYHSPKGTVVEGRGVVPDVIVPETRAAFTAGKDPVLDAAVEHLSTGTGT